jgi:nitrate/nitrite transporter NarK
MLGYLVTYLNLELGHTLVAAGLVLTISQISTVFARVAWGVLADRLGDPLRVLGIIAMGSGALGLVVAGFQPGWDVVAIGAALVLYSLFTMGWNGVHLATVTRYARGDIPSAMIGTQLFSFIGMLGGPLVFAGIVSVAGRYWVGFAVFAACSLAAGAALLRLAPRLAGRQAAESLA